MQSAEPLLLRVVVDLDDDPVDLVVELRPAVLPHATALGDLLHRFETLGERVDREAVTAQPVQRLPVRSELHTVVRADSIRPERQRTVRSDRRILLAQRAGSGIARVRCGLLPLSDEPLVQLAEAGERHVHLAANLDQLRGVASEHPQGNRRDRAQIDSHVFADLTVAARRTAREDAVLVREVDRETVDLRFEHVGDRRGVAKALVDVLGPFLDRFVGRHLLERAHRGLMPNLLELRRRGSPDALGRRVRRHELRVLALQFLELVVGAVVRGVVDRRLVEHVVLVQPAVEQVAQLGGSRRAQEAPPGDRR